MDRIEDLSEQKEEWREKYRRTFDHYEAKQLENDHLKMEILALNNSHEALAAAYQQVTLSLQQLRQQHLEQQQDSHHQQQHHQQQQQHQQQQHNHTS